MEDEVGKTEVGAIMFSRFYHLAICFYSLVSPHLSMGLVGPFWHEQAWAHFKLNSKRNHNIFLEKILPIINFTVLLSSSYVVIQ